MNRLRRIVKQGEHTATTPAAAKAEVASSATTGTEQPAEAQAAPEQDSSPAMVAQEGDELAPAQPEAHLDEAPEMAVADPTVTERPVVEAQEDASYTAIDVADAADMTQAPDEPAAPEEAEAGAAVDIMESEDASDVAYAADGAYAADSVEIVDAGDAGDAVPTMEAEES